MSKLVIGLFFGGRSVEHEVSVITALQVYENIDKNKYEIIPIYVSKAGEFYTSPKFLDLKNYRDTNGLLLSSSKVHLITKNSTCGILLSGIFPKFIPLDVAFPLFHGSFGEDGAIQGLFEIYQIPYVGFNVTGSALGMDKVLQKATYRELGLNVGKYFAFKRSEWLENSEACINVILGRSKPRPTPESDKLNDSGQARMTDKGGLKFPLVVKPATIGSSIGINRVSDEDSLSFAIEVASTYADKILIEEAFGEDIVEVNCSALGYGTDVKASVCEMPVRLEELLSFADKYQRGDQKGSKASGMASMSRIIPAPISEKLTKEIQKATEWIFKSLDGCGVARVDFFVDQEKEKFWVNEINTPPGSLAYYLWEKSGIKFSKLLDLLITYALERFEDQKKTTYTFESGLLTQMALQGGSKSKA